MLIVDDQRVKQGFEFGTLLVNEKQCWKAPLENESPIHHLEHCVLVTKKQTGIFPFKIIFIHILQHMYKHRYK